MSKADRDPKRGPPALVLYHVYGCMRKSKAISSQLITVSNPASDSAYGTDSGSNTLGNLRHPVPPSEDPNRIGRGPKGGLRFLGEPRESGGPAESTKSDVGFSVYCFLRFE